MLFEHRRLQPTSLGSLKSAPVPYHVCFVKLGESIMVSAVGGPPSPATSAPKKEEKKEEVKAEETKPAEESEKPPEENKAEDAKGGEETNDSEPAEDKSDEATKVSGESAKAQFEANQNMQDKSTEETEDADTASTEVIKDEDGQPIDTSDAKETLDQIEGVSKDTKKDIETLADDALETIGSDKLDAAVDDGKADLAALSDEAAEATDSKTLKALAEDGTVDLETVTNEAGDALDSKALKSSTAKGELDVAAVADEMVASTDTKALKTALKDGVVDVKDVGGKDVVAALEKSDTAALTEALNDEKNPFTLALKNKDAEDLPLTGGLPPGEGGSSGSKKKAPVPGATDEKIGYYDQSISGPCWWLSTVEGFSNDKKGKAEIKEAITKNKSGWTVKFDGNGDKGIKVSESDVANQPFVSQGSDKDMKILSVAADKYFRAHDEIDSGMRGGGSGDDAMRLLTGGGWKAPDSSKAEVKNFLKNASDNVNKGMVITAAGRATSNGEVSFSGSSNHTVNITKITDKTVTYINPRDSEDRHTVSLDKMAGQIAANKNKNYSYINYTYV